MGRPALISIDWGTSSFRAFLLDANGEILDKRLSNDGIMKVRDGNFSIIFDNMLKRWIQVEPNLPVLMSGMIGSEQGWSFAPHIALPASLKDIVASLHTVHNELTRKVFIVPGLITSDQSNVSDIMRGEETQIIGCLEDKPLANSIICLPGTHSKWVKISNNVITEFHTSLTGETFDILSTHSILRRLMKDGKSRPGKAFELGLNRSKEAGGLLHHLFGVRSQGFTKAINQNNLKSYLTGILIGHEIIGMKEIYSSVKSITIIGNKDLLKIYKNALNFFFIDSNIIDGNTAAIRGHIRIAKMSAIV